MNGLKLFEGDDRESMLNDFGRDLRAILEKQLGDLYRPEEKLIPPKPPHDLSVASLIQHPSVVLIVGHRGSGKSALACRLQELKQDIAPPYAGGLPSRATRLLPK